MEIQGRRLRSGESRASGSKSTVAGSSRSGGSGTSTQQSGRSRDQNSTDSAATPVEVEVDEDEDSSSSGSGSEDGEGYGDMHRLILQGVMSAGYLNVKGVKKLFEESCRFLRCKVPAAEHLAPPFIQKVVREINERIKNFDMMIRSSTCEITGEKYYVCIVTIEKQIMKAQTFFTKMELDLFQRIIDSVLKKHNDFLITINECINLGAEMDSRFSKVNAEEFVNKMINLQYLTKVFKGNQEFELTLGFRTIREFETIFRESYSACFGTCCLCRMILLNGLTCPHCPTVYHRACLRKYIKNCKTCVKCKGKWRSEKSLPVRTMDGSGGKAPTTTPEETSHENSSSGIAVTPVQGQAKRTENLVNNSKDDVDIPVAGKIAEINLCSQSKTKETPATSSTGNCENSTSQRGKKDTLGRSKLIREIESSSDSESN